MSISPFRKVRPWVWPPRELSDEEVGMAKAGSPEEPGLGPPYPPALLAVREWGTGGLGLGCYSDIKAVILRCSWTLGRLC